MEHWTPHINTQFEGWYSKFEFPSGSSLAIIISTVPNAVKKPHLLSITYHPHSQRSEVFQREIFVPSIERVRLDSNAFELRVEGFGIMTCSPTGMVTYDFSIPDFQFHATTSPFMPWKRNGGPGAANTPFGWQVHLPLPLHWHVQDLAASGSYSLNLPNHSGFLEADVSGTVSVHQEKNWASSFPEKHMWVQARAPDNSAFLCLAGGRLLGLDLYNIGFRSQTNHIDIRPPLCVGRGSLSLTTKTNVDWENRAFGIRVNGLWRSLEVNCSAPKGTWFGITAPFGDGHRENFLAESWNARVEVVVKKRGLLGLLMCGGWKETERKVFENAALEFGGAFYGDVGTEKKRS
ncbi:hypothetical protein M501DRAFT_927092 [Patellaria atrata CBS 101060]|uniref:Uncharacterized protein n=1 Tax=Patellaria atrata CBS 101060 TaxID=1346257 RepID=A0A9P4VU92_9PEZI|nr:hypothetical protein M501DRAFT_927092 [Patellaria atrata CBS 101060]